MNKLGTLNKLVMKKKRSFYLLLVLICTALQCCKSGEEEWIEQCDENLISDKYHWISKFNYDFEGFELTCFDEYYFSKDHTFKEIITYCYDDVAYAQVLYSGEWEIEYDKNLDAYFFNESSELDKINNLAMNQKMFNLFDTEIRSNYYGDAYDTISDSEDSDVLYGMEVIDCTKDLFIIKYLSSGDMSKYHRISGGYNVSESRDDYMQLYSDI